MYKKIKIFIVISIVSFTLMILASIFGNFIPPRFATVTIILVFSLFFIFGMSLVPLLLRAVLSGNIHIWKKIPAKEKSFSAGMRSYVTQNVERIFHVLLFALWGIFIAGLAIALPAMIKDGFFKPGAFEATVSDGGSEVIVQNEYNETVYSMKDVPIRLSVYHGGNEGSIKIDSRSDLPIAEQISVMDALVRKAFAEENAPPDTLFLGTIYDSFGDYKEMSRRLAEAALASALWDVKKGCAVDGNDNRAVKAILSENDIYRELADMFRRHRLIIKVKTVEKVRVGEDKLPFDAMLWFSVEKG